MGCADRVMTKPVGKRAFAGAQSPPIFMGFFGTAEVVP